MILGLLADIHGDYDGFMHALRLFEHQQVQQIICAGDIVDRGPDADRIVAVLQRLPIVCVAGNHEATVLLNQERWRASERPQRLRSVGRIVSDPTLEFIAGLPSTAQLNLAGQRILVAHGAPWSDITTVSPFGRDAVLRRLYAEYSASTDAVIVGHSHLPFHLVLNETLHILNPGSIYGVTARDSHTCMVVRLPEWQAFLFDLRTGAESQLNYRQRAVS